MLRGQILRIKWIGVFEATVKEKRGVFEATIDGKSKRFDDWQSMYNWFTKVLKYSKDDKKRALLMEDLSRICDKSG